MTRTMGHYDREYVDTTWIAVLCALLSVGLVGCGGTPEYRRTGGSYAARGPLCDYEVIRDRTIEPYEEVGTIDIAAFSVGQLPDNEEKFRKVVGKAVCDAGGDAVIPGINLYGKWIIGTVIRFDPPECKDCDDETMHEDG